MGEKVKILDLDNKGNMIKKENILEDESFVLRSSKEP
jgi:hypothetical protein